MRIHDRFVIAKLLVLRYVVFDFNDHEQTFKFSQGHRL